MIFAKKLWSRHTYLSGVIYHMRT